MLGKEKKSFFLPNRGEEKKTGGGARQKCSKREQEY